MRTPSPTLRLLLPLLCAGTLAGCGDGERQADPAPERDERSQQDGALGGNATVGTLARAPMQASAPRGAAWIGHRVRLEPGEKLEHRHAFSTVYAEKEGHLLDADSDRSELKPGSGAIVQAGTSHVHEARSGRPSVFWDVLLAVPGAKLPGKPDSERVFESEPLEGLPDGAQVSFLDVGLPPGGQTTVHSHPGPETIYVIKGPFEYQNGIEGTSTADKGDVKSIPPGTAVQKRNPGEEPARFLSWFIVDPSQEFAPAAEFDGRR